MVTTELGEAVVGLNALDPFCRRKGKSDFAKQLKDEDGFGGGDGPRIIVDQNGMGPTGGYITR